mgnify:CR=1 FL=1
MEFNMFNYLKLKGLDNSELAKHFEKIDETNENINSILEKNPGAILKEIKVTYLDKEKKKILTIFNDDTFIQLFFSWEKNGCRV